VALSKFVFEMAEPGHLASVLAAVRKVEGVFDVYRLTGSRADAEHGTAPVTPA
jgi:guanosine-3',5'-bis(diphosphate) 3'-pyrophosphohydrolase